MSSVLAFFKERFTLSDEIREKKRTPLHILFSFCCFVLLFVFIYLSYTIVKPLNMEFGTIDGMMAKAYGAILFTILVVSYLILRLRHKTNLEINILYIMLFAFVIKLVYMLYTTGHTRQYDTWSSNHNGHYDYATFIFDNWSLPNHIFNEGDVYQFYHPPLHYFISAIWMKVYAVFGFESSLVDTTENLFCSVQILSTFFTFLISYYAVKTLRLVCKSKTSLYIGAIFVCFFPRLFQLSGQINNDVLAGLFIILSIYRLFKYIFEKKSYKNICLSSLYLGLAMSAKLSAVIVCLGFAFYFIYAFIRSVQKKEGELKTTTQILHYLCFLVIVAPIGLWFQVYAHKVYGLPYNFVFRALNSELFTGPRSYVLSHDYLSVKYYDEHNSGAIYTNGFVNFIARYILPFWPADMEASIVYADAFENYNILTYAIKSSIFGEFDYWGGEGFGFIAVIAAYVSWFLLIGISIYNLYKKRFDLPMIVAMAIVGSIIVFYLYLQITMPYGCSMDARYIYPILLPLGIVVMKNIEMLPSSGKVNVLLKYTLSFSVVIFAIAGGLFYCFAI